MDDDDFTVIRVKPSPVDCLGYPYRCCHCIPLTIGVILICIISFMWAIIELTKSEKFMATIFIKKDGLFKFAKVLHIFIIMCFLISCGVLMLGISVRKRMPIHVFIWIGFVFNCICIFLDVLSIAVQTIFVGKLEKGAGMIMALCVIWHCTYFYFLSVVNSFKFRIVWI